MTTPYRPFWHWILRQPFDCAAISFGLLFIVLSALAGEHCVDQLSVIAFALRGTGQSYCVPFPGDIVDTAICIFAYGGFAVTLVWRRVVRRPARFTIIYGTQLLVLGSVLALDRFVSWLSTWPNVDSDFLIAQRERPSSHINVNVDWSEVVVSLTTSVTALLLIQFLLARLGWGMLRPRFRFRASLFVRSCAYTSLLAGPVMFAFYLLMGGMRVFLDSVRPTETELESLLLIAWIMYSLLMPVAVAIRLVRRRAWRLWLSCKHCGYALRGNISGRCPECGTTCEVPA